MSESYENLTGLKQGDELSIKLFKIVLECVKNSFNKLLTYPHSISLYVAQGP
jgi:hypothetical protein